MLARLTAAVVIAGLALCGVSPPTQADSGWGRGRQWRRRGRGWGHYRPNPGEAFVGGIIGGLIGGLLGGKDDERRDREEGPRPEGRDQRDWDAPEYGRRD